MYVGIHNQLMNNQLKMILDSAIEPIASSQRRGVRLWRWSICDDSDEGIGKMWGTVEN